MKNIFHFVKSFLILCQRIFIYSFLKSSPIFCKRFLRQTSFDIPVLFQSFLWQAAISKQFFSYHSETSKYSLTYLNDLLHVTEYLISCYMRRTTEPYLDIYSLFQCWKVNGEGDKRKKFWVKKKKTYLTAVSLTVKLI